MNGCPAVGSGCSGDIHDIVNMSAVRDDYDQFIVKLHFGHLFIHLPLICHVGKCFSSAHAFKRDSHHDPIPGNVDHKFSLCIFKKIRDLFSGDDSRDQSFLHGLQAQKMKLLLGRRPSSQHSDDRGDIFTFIELH